MILRGDVSIRKRHWKVALFRCYDILETADIRCIRHVQQGADASPRSDSAFRALRTSGRLINKHKRLIRPSHSLQGPLVLCTGARMARRCPDVAVWLSD